MNYLVGAYAVILAVLFLRTYFANIKFYKYAEKFYPEHSSNSLFEAIFGSGRRWSLQTNDYMNDFKKIDDEEFHILWNKVKNGLLLFFIVFLSIPVVFLCIFFMSNHD